MTEPSSRLQARLAERRAQQAAAAQAAVPPMPVGAYDDLVPTEDGYELSQADRELDAAVDGIGILEAYDRWVGGARKAPLAGQKESIKISCPVPGHNDEDPSAWVNLEKNTWYCGRCEQGGDAHDLAAWAHGYPVPGYKSGKDFGRLRKMMAEDFGYRIDRTLGGTTIVIPPEAIEPPPEAPAAPIPATGVAEPTPPPPLSIVPQMVEDEDDEDLSENLKLIRGIPRLDWESIVPKGTFLDAYMQACRIDDVPEEYHFWNGLIAIGFALNRQVKLHDTKEVYGNIFVCTLGPSGSGKSKAAGHLKELLSRAMPYKADDYVGHGVARISSPGSAEALIQRFQKPIPDPTNPKRFIGYAPVSGLIDFNELSGLVGRANRSGSVLKPTLMEFYDAESLISTGSLTTGEKEAHMSFAQALTTTQPKALRNLLGAGDDDSGFLNRWVFVAGPPKKRVAVGGARIDPEPAVNPLKRIAAWASTFREDEYMEWGPESVDIFTEWFDERYEKDMAAHESSMLNRVDLLMKKLLLLLSGNKQEKMVSGNTVREAISLYDYLKACYAVPEQQIRMTLGNEIGDTILQVIERYQATHEKQGPTMREITKLLWRKNYPKDQIVKMMRTLQDLGLISEVIPKVGSAGGRPTVRYSAHAS